MKFVCCAPRAFGDLAALDGRRAGSLRLRAPAALALWALFALGSPPALASKDLATQNGCIACHAPDRKVLGPSYADVAKKYAGQKDAVAQLAESIRKGGMGKWGPVPMPAQPALSDADLQALAAWVLAGGK